MGKTALLHYLADPRLHTNEVQRSEFRHARCPAVRR
jgi:hypothetical protein